MYDVKKISIDDILLPPFKDRFENEFVNDGRCYIADIPIKVVFSKESKKYILIEGRAIYLKVSEPMRFACLCKIAKLQNCKFQLCQTTTQL